MVSIGLVVQLDVLVTSAKFPLIPIEHAIGDSDCVGGENAVGIGVSYLKAAAIQGGVARENAVGNRDVMDTAHAPKEHVDPAPRILCFVVIELAVFYGHNSTVIIRSKVERQASPSLVVDMPVQYFQHCESILVTCSRFISVHVAPPDRDLRRVGGAIGLTVADRYATSVATEVFVLVPHAGAVGKGRVLDADDWGIVNVQSPTRGEVSESVSTLTTSLHSSA